MVEFMEAEPQFARGVVSSGSQYKNKTQSLWVNLSEKLNSLRPPIKQVEKWKKVSCNQRKIN